jgi:hypothetical protein
MLIMLPNIIYQMVIFLILNLSIYYKFFQTNSKKGLSREKLILGIPSYGRSFSGVTNPNKLGSSATGPASAGRVIIQ